MTDQQLAEHLSRHAPVLYVEPPISSLVRRLRARGVAPAPRLRLVQPRTGRPHAAGAAGADAAGRPVDHAGRPALGRPARRRRARRHRGRRRGRAPRPRPLDAPRRSAGPVRQRRLRGRSRAHAHPRAPAAPPGSAGPLRGRPHHHRVGVARRDVAPPRSDRRRRAERLRRRALRPGGHRSRGPTTSASPGPSPCSPATCPSASTSTCWRRWPTAASTSCSSARASPASAASGSTACSARPNVQWVGPRPHEALPAYLGAARVGLVPYTDTRFNRHSFPLKALEYLAAGLPVVGTDLPALRQLAGEAGADVTVAAAPAAFVDAVESLVARVAQPSSAAVRRAFAAQHDWAHRAQRFAELIGVAAPDAAPPAPVPMPGDSAGGAAE